MIAWLKHIVLNRLKDKKLKRKRSSALCSYTSSSFDSDEAATARSRRNPSGFVAVYVGKEKHRFVIPTRFVDFPVFAALLDQADEELGYKQTAGYLTLPCEMGFFLHVLRCLVESEAKFSLMGLDEFAKMVYQVDLELMEFDEFTPLLRPKKCHGLKLGF